MPLPCSVFVSCLKTYKLQKLPFQDYQRTEACWLCRTKMWHNSNLRFLIWSGVKINEFLIECGACWLRRTKLWQQPSSPCRSKEYKCFVSPTTNEHDSNVALSLRVVLRVYIRCRRRGGSQQYTNPVASHMYSICSALVFT